MKTDVKFALAELALYTFAVWLSVEMARTHDERRATRLKRYLTTAQTFQRLAYACGRCAIRAELAYYKEVQP